MTTSGGVIQFLPLGMFKECSIVPRFAFVKFVQEFGIFSALTGETFLKVDDVGKVLLR